MSDVLTQQALQNALPTGLCRVPIPGSISPKSNKLLTWLSLPDRSLRRMVIAFHPASDHGKICMNKIVFLPNAEPAASPEGRP
jgi:hypothetical protein